MLIDFPVITSTEMPRDLCRGCSISMFGSGSKKLCMEMAS